MSCEKQKDNEKVFEKRMFLNKRYSRASVNRVCLNDLFQDPKIQVKIPHTLITKNIINKTRRISQKDVKLENMSKNKLKSFQSKYNRYIQTYKSMKVHDQVEQQRINTKIEEACRQLSRESINNPAKYDLLDAKNSMLCRKLSVPNSRVADETEKPQKQSMSVQFRPNNKDFLISLSYFNRKGGSNSQNINNNNKSSHLTKRRVSQITLHSKSLKIRQMDIRIISKPKSSLKRQNRSAVDQKVQPICGWNLDEPEDL